MSDEIADKAEKFSGSLTASLLEKAQLKAGNQKFSSYIKNLVEADISGDSSLKPDEHYEDIIGHVAIGYPLVCLLLKLNLQGSPE